MTAPWPSCSVITVRTGKPFCATNTSAWPSAAAPPAVPAVPRDEGVRASAVPVQEPRESCDRLTVDRPGAQFAHSLRPGQRLAQPFERRFRQRRLADLRLGGLGCLHVLPVDGDQFKIPPGRASPTVDRGPWRRGHGDQSHCRCPPLETSADAQKKLKEQYLPAGGEVVSSPDIPPPSSSFSKLRILPSLCGTVTEVFSEKRRLVICSSPIFCSSACRLGGMLAGVWAAGGADNATAEPEKIGNDAATPNAASSATRVRNPALLETPLVTIGWQAYRGSLGGCCPLVGVVIATLPGLW